MSTQIDFYCPKCAATYSKSEFGPFASLRCKECKTPLAWGEPAGVKASNSTKAAKAVVSEKNGSNRPVDASGATDLTALVAAQNRTTHAVRSLATFFFISILSSVTGYGFVSAGAPPFSCAIRQADCGNEGLVIFGWLVIVVGFFVALGVGVSELNKSRIN